MKKNRITPGRDILHLCNIEPGNEGASFGINNGTVLELITLEDDESDEEPYFHLFPGSHIDRKDKSNNYDLITRVKITKDLPSVKDDIVSIQNNPPVPEEYKEFILKWSKEYDKFGINNWKFLQCTWNCVQNIQSF